MEILNWLGCVVSFSRQHMNLHQPWTIFENWYLRNIEAVENNVKQKSITIFQHHQLWNGWNLTRDALFNGDINTNLDPLQWQRFCVLRMVLFHRLFSSSVNFLKDISFKKYPHMTAPESCLCVSFHTNSLHPKDQIFHQTLVISHCKCLT